MKGTTKQPEVLYQIRFNVKVGDETETGIAYSSPSRSAAIHVWQSLDCVTNYCEDEQGILAGGFVWLDFVAVVGDVAIGLVLSLNDAEIESDEAHEAVAVA